MKTLDYPDRHYLNAALGWLELGNPSEARDEAGRISILGRIHEETFLIRWLPVLLRLGILVLGLGLFFGARQTSSGQAAAMPLLAVLHALAISLIVFGIVARASAILALCILGFYQMLASLAPVQIALAVAYTAILYLGSGAFSLWAPEDQLVYRRAGEPRKADAEQVP